MNIEFDDVTLFFGGIKALLYYPLSLVNVFKFSTTWGCVSLPRSTTSSENYSYLFNLSPNTYKFWFLDTHFIHNNSDLVD